MAVFKDTGTPVEGIDDDRDDDIQRVENCNTSTLCNK
jgi:hypothetical protein